MKLVLGTAQFGMKYGVANKSGHVCALEISEILRTAQLAGMNTIDTAISYGNSEKSLGAQGMSGWNVITKLPEIPNVDNPYNWISRQLNTSCANLGLKKIYGLLLHRPMQLSGNRGSHIWTSLLKLKEEKKVQKIGISIYSVNELNYFQNMEVDIIQIPINIIDRSFERSGLASGLKMRGIEIHARSIFLQGLLLMDPAAIPPYFKRWNHIFKIYDTWIKSNKITRLEGALGYVNSLPFVDCIVVGVDSKRHLEDIINSSLNMNDDFPNFPESDLSLLVNPSKWDLI